MNIIAVDDERFALKELESAIKEALPNCALNSFDTPSAALRFAQTEHIDIAFLDIEMAGMSGLKLAKQLKDIHGKTNIIFVTGFSHHAADAFALHASGYLLKPVTTKAVAETVKCLRYPVKTTSKKRLRVQTFGNFDVFVDGEPLKFYRNKSKELFAYLVSRRGARCNNDEIIAALWGDRAEDTDSLKSLFRTLVADVIQTLKKVGITDVVVKQRGYLSVAAEKISCDMYDFCNGKNVNLYMGDFMNQYDWAEFTSAYLDRIYDKFAD